MLRAWSPSARLSVVTAGRTPGRRLSAHCATRPRSRPRSSATHGGRATRWRRRSWGPWRRPHPHRRRHRFPCLTPRASCACPRAAMRSHRGRSRRLRPRWRPRRADPPPRISGVAAIRPVSGGLPQRPRYLDAHPAGAVGRRYGPALPGRKCHRRTVPLHCGLPGGGRPETTALASVGFVGWQASGGVDFVLELTHFPW